MFQHVRSGMRDRDVTVPLNLLRDRDIAHWVYHDIPGLSNYSVTCQRLIAGCNSELNKDVMQFSAGAMNNNY